MTSAGSDVPAAARILLVEDDENLGVVVEDALELRGYDVDLRRNGDDGHAAFLEGGFDLCLIDVMLPRRDGFSLARAIRAADDRLPIIFLTARSLAEDRIEGFRIGADDYVTKPFNLEELVLRIGAVLKRSGAGHADQPAQTEWRLGSLTFSPIERRLTGPDGHRTLTHKEAELLRLLCLHADGVLERSEALRQVWGSDTIYTSRSMDVFVSRLRRHLRDEPRLEILNLHGVGYRLVVHPTSG